VAASAVAPDSKNKIIMITLSNETNEVLEHLNDVIVFKNKIGSFSEKKGFRGD
jgi:hypothetical protein